MVPWATHAGPACQHAGVRPGARQVSFQGMDQAQWTGLVSKMRDNYRTPLSDSDIQSIGLYLSAAYGSEERAPLPVAQAGNLDDLLSRNACLGCHALEQKIVGPSFKDIAQRYREQPEALRTVAGHIGEGGSGRWGQIPMPPFTGLSSEELEHLARYVLEQ
ncbi:c-type cytochrome [Pseudomonas sp. TNT2022 ID1025]|uniref:Cytochrome c-551 n=2 Tax=Pseudomonas rubra TaxID=2942627 RepID=A0ABT5P1S0_9PSED|nr:c-type cytochrome [Pseudomonas rubra]MDD1012221.1 c-type cytochrome [Pseudomonas rubra]MDD1037432.1 c-type cytochrome [Pseudomonas rubra]